MSTTSNVEDRVTLCSRGSVLGSGEGLRCRRTSYGLCTRAFGAQLCLMGIAPGQWPSRHRESPIKPGNRHTLILNCVETCRIWYSTHFDANILSWSSSFVWYLSCLPEPVMTSTEVALRWQMLGMPPSPKGAELRAKAGQGPTLSWPLVTRRQPAPGLQDDQPDPSKTNCTHWSTFVGALGLGSWHPSRDPLN